MSIDTDHLISVIVEDAAPVKRLRSPLVRLGLWVLVASVLVFGPLLLGRGPRPELPFLMRDDRFLFEMASTLLTGLAAAYAALAAAVPGRSSRILLLPLIPLALWLGSLVIGTLHDWHFYGSLGLCVTTSISCLRGIMFLSIVPGLLLFTLLRRAVPLHRIAIAATAALAVSSFASFGVSLEHDLNTSLMVLIWHMGTIAAVVGGAAAASRYLLKTPIG